MHDFAQELSAALATDPAFATVSDEHLSELALCFEEARCAAGERLIREGGREHAMYVLLEGRAAIERGGVEYGALDPGAHFGDLSLVAGGPRPTTIVARTALRLACLSKERLELLEREQPAQALRLVRALLSGFAARLVDMSMCVGLSLRERNLPRQATFEVRVEGQARTVRSGTPVGDLLPETVGEHLVVAALVDRRPMSLRAPVSKGCSIEVLTTGHWEGKRIYRRSLMLLLVEAAHHVAPELVLRAEHSVGFALRVTVDADVEPEASLAARVQEAMAKLVGDDRRLREEWWAVDEARRYFREKGWTGAAALLQTWREPAAMVASYGAVSSLSLEPLVERTGLLSGYALAPDDAGLLLYYGPQAATRPQTNNVVAPSVFPPRLSKTRPSSIPPPGLSADVYREARQTSRQLKRMTEPQQTWLRTMRIESVGDFNQACVSGSVSPLIRVAEGFHEKRIADIAEVIAAQHDQVRVVCIAGPSSTGKTTFIKRLSVQLQVAGIRPVGVSLDDYYVDRVSTPKTDKGEYDFEAFEALDGALLQDQLGALLEGREVSLASYDFATGLSHAGGGAQIGLGSKDVLLLEGIHGLNPRLLESLPEQSVFRVFVCPLAQLPFDRVARVHPSDVRLLRRIVRDRHARGYDAAATIARWPSVRRGERSHIFPFQHLADAIFDTSLLYELSVLRVYAERYLFEVPPDHPSYTTAYRLLGLLSRFVPIYPDHVPPTSILREFIGESGFEY